MGDFPPSIYFYIIGLNQYRIMNMHFLLLYYFTYFIEQVASVWVMRALSVGLMFCVVFFLYIAIFVRFLLTLFHFMELKDTAGLSYIFLASVL